MRCQPWVSCAAFTVWLATVAAVEAEALRLPGAVFEGLDETRFPSSPFVVDVRQAPYSARGDGQTDDTEALQQALDDSMGLHRMIYLPEGTYLISRPLRWSKRNSAGREAWGYNLLQGQHPERTVLRLKEGSFTDPANPQPMMWCGGFGSADWFHNYVQGLTFEIGPSNAGAIALQFYSNNSGAVRHCRFIAPATEGFIGLDLGHRDMNGPLLVSNCLVQGFRRGIATSRAVNGQVFEGITLRGQTEVGFENSGQTVTLRRLHVEGPAPVAVRSYGSLTLIDSVLACTSTTSKLPAVINYNGGRCFLRDVKAVGYARAVGDVESPDWYGSLQRGKNIRGPAGMQVDEYWTGFDESAAGRGSLRLEVRDPPIVPSAPTSMWANVDAYGADPTGKSDSSAAVQKAMDSGSTTVFLPGSYAFHTPVIVRGAVRRVIGVGGSLDYYRKSRPDFRIEDGVHPVVQFEHFSHIHGGVEVDTARTLVFRSVADCDFTFSPRAEGGEIFMEDVVTHGLRLKGQKVWARQLNIENEGTHLTNDAGRLWVLGYKTERGGTLLETLGDGRSEILGGFSYTTTAGRLAPMFVTRDSAVFAWFAEVCFNGDPFQTLVQERQGKETWIQARSEAGTLPYRSRSPR